MRRIVATCLVVVGAFVLLSAVVEPLKAHLGHMLLSRTFEARLTATGESQADPDEWRPWPGADLAPVAELHFPATGDRRIVVDSASGEALAWAVGHVPGTAQPGAPGVTAIAGHRDGRFALLGGVDVGDTIELRTLDGETRRYRIDAREVVDSGDVQLPIDHDGRDELILTTCWPIDGLVSGPERLLLHAHAIA